MDQQIVLLLFTHLTGSAAEWYAAKVGGTPPNSWARSLPNLGVGWGGPPQLKAAAFLSTLKMSKDQQVADYFAKVMWPCKDD